MYLSGNERCSKARNDCLVLLAWGGRGAVPYFAVGEPYETYVVTLHRSTEK